MAVKIFNVINRGIRIRKNGVFTAPELITDAGVFFEEAGGYYAGGNILVDGKEYAVIVSPKESGQSSTELTWKTVNNQTLAADSSYNGRYNTNALVNASGTHPAANFCNNLIINGFDDWHLPAPDELEICYRYLKPTQQQNSTGESDTIHGIRGVNPNSNPVGEAYTLTNPSQTNVSEFITSNSQSFDSKTYWTSMNNTTVTYWAWGLHFPSGVQGANVIANPNAVRAVRWMEV